jgi:hypothetical protein
MIEFFVTHVGNTYDPNGGYGTFKVNSLSYSFKNQDKGSINYSLALDQSDYNNIPIGSSEFGPKRTDFTLSISTDGGTTLESIHRGILCDVGLSLGSGVINCQGWDYFWLGEQPWPFDYQILPQNLSGNLTITGSLTTGKFHGDWIYGWVNQPMNTILNDILGWTILDQNAVGFMDTNIKGDWTDVMSFYISHGDSTTILDHIKSLAGLDTPFGFDFFQKDNVFHFAKPRLVTPTGNLNPIAFLQRDNEITGLEWHNTGPKNTKDVAIASSIGELLWKESTYTDSVSQFRSWLGLTDLGQTYMSAASIAKAAEAIGYLNRSPQKTLTLTIRPEVFDPFDEAQGYRNMIGEVIHYWSDDLFHPYWTIDAYFWIISQDYHTDETGLNMVCDLGLQQIY